MKRRGNYENQKRRNQNLNNKDMKLSEIISEMEKWSDYARQQQITDNRQYWEGKEYGINECIDLLKALNDEDWVSVEKEKPEVEKRVIVYTGMKYPDDIMIGYMSEKTGWWFDEDANYLSIPVLFWKERPTPPNIENSNQ